MTMTMTMTQTNLAEKKFHYNLQEDCENILYIPYFPLNISVDVIVYIIEKVHELGKVDFIQSNIKDNTLTCYIQITYWNYNTMSQEVQHALMAKESYKIYYTQSLYLLFLSCPKSYVYTNVQHMDLLLMVPKTMDIKEIQKTLDHLYLGTVHNILYDYKEITEENNAILHYDISQPINEDKQIVLVIFDYWFASRKTHTVQDRILKHHFYNYNKTIKMYYSKPQTSGVNPYNYNNNNYSNSLQY
jgi:hypothetical protein